MLHHISTRQKVIVMIAVMSGMFLVALDQTIIATALTAIVKDFNSFSSLGLVVTAYLLMNTITVPIAGRMSDVFGRKPLLLCGVAVFTIGSLLSGMAGNIDQLIAFRILQGFGGGIITANAFTIIGDLFTPRERGRWQGFTGAVFGVASVAGPLLGGYLTDEHVIMGLMTTWRWTFFINVPVGIIATLMIIRYCPAIKHEKNPIIDYKGAATIALALASVVLAVDNTELIFKGLIDNGVGLTLIKTALFAFAAVMTLVFIWVEGRAKEPIIPLSFFKNRTYSSVMVAALLFGAAFLGAILYLTQFNQQVFGANATDAGLMLLPMIGGMMVTSIGIGQIVSRTGKYKRFIIAGYAVAALGVFALALLTPTSPYWHEAIIMVLVGVGLGAGMPIMTLAVQNEFEQKDLGAATASSQLFRGLGSTLGMAVLSAVLTTGVAAGISDISNSPYIQAVRQGSGSAAFIPQDIDANTALQLNSQSSAIKQQAMKAIDASPLPPAAKEAQKVQFTKNQDDFKNRVANVFTDSLHTVFYISGALMVLALVAVTFIRERELRGDPLGAPGIAE